MANIVSRFYQTSEGFTKITEHAIRLDCRRKANRHERSRVITLLRGLITNSALQSQLERFWNQEETQETRSLTREEADCKRQFCESFKRDSDGRFIVALPVRPDIILGDSKPQAACTLSRNDSKQIQN